MRLGLLADIHEESRFLRAALDCLGRENLDRIVVLGDVFEMGYRLEGTIRMLAEAGAVGVWGNHDFGLCRDPHPSVVARFSPDCLAFMASLQPTLEFGDVLITHVEPWRDPHNIFELWSFETPDPPARSFLARPHRIMLHGHHHRWKVTTPDGPVAWDCFHPLRLEPDHRYLIEVGAVVDGRCGILDTQEGLLIPIDLRDGD